jgi:hypothetical protein
MLLDHSFVEMPKLFVKCILTPFQISWWNCSGKYFIFTTYIFIYMLSKLISGIVNSNLARGIIVFVEYWIWQIWPIFTVGQGSLFNIIKMPCNSLTFQNFVPPFFWHLFLRHIARWSVHLEWSPLTNYIHLVNSQLTCQHRVLKKPLYLQVYLVLFHNIVTSAPPSLVDLWQTMPF